MLYFNVNMQDFEKTNFIVAILPSVIICLAGIILWYIAPKLANSIFKPKPDQTNSPVTVEDFHGVAFSVAGLYLLTMSLSAIVEFVVYQLYMVKTQGSSPLTSLISPS